MINQKNQAQNNKYNIHENLKIVDHDYEVEDKVVLINNTEYKYEMPYNGPFVKTKCCTNGTVMLQWVVIK